MGEREYSSVMSRCEIRSLPTLSYFHTRLSSCFSFSQPCHYPLGIKAIAYLHLQLLEVGGSTGVVSMRSCYRWFPRLLLQPYTTLLVK